MRKITFLVIMLCSFFSYSQCSITSNVNASALTCGAAPLSGCSGIVYIGDGITPVTLTMNANLNLSCLGAIRLIVRNNGEIDFSSGNFDLTLASGSSIEFESGAALDGGSTCSASDRIIIGGVRLASCNGGSGAQYSFATLVSNGGYSPINLVASPSTICGSGSSTLTATVNPSSGATIRWYTVASGGTQIATGSTYNTPVLTSSTTYYAEAVYASYTTVRRPVTVRILANNTASSASSSPSTCVNSPMTSITHTTTGATGIGTPTSLPTGVSASWSGDVITISGTPTAAGNFNYSIPLSGGCGSVNATGTIVVNNQPAAPTISSITQPDCMISTGSVLLSGLPSVGTWTVNPGNVSGSGTSVTISGLAVNTYNFTVTNSNGCVSTASVNVVINNAINNVWNGSAWSEGSPPRIEQIATISGNYSTALGNFTCCSLVINPGATLTIASGNYIEIDNGLANNGVLIIENNASLIQLNDAGVNSGTGVNTMYRNPTNLHLYDYVYWSSPQVTTSFASIPNSRYYEWVPNYANPTGYGYGNWFVPSGTTMVQGKGYIFRVPNSLNQNVTFTGSVFNNGVITSQIRKANFTGTTYTGINGFITNTDDNWNLIGNPYPSAIDALEFVNDNSAVLENGDIYIWRHLNQISTSNSSPYYQSYTYSYNVNDFVVYTAGTGSVPAGAFDGKIASGQGFFVRMKDDPSVGLTSNVTFNNSQRNKTYNNSQFFRATNTKVANETEKHRIWLDLVNTKNLAESLLVGYVQGATNDNDFLYESKSNLKSDFQFYSIIDNASFKIQGRKLPFDENDSVALGVIVPIDGKYTIALNSVDGLFKNTSVKIYIQDKLTGIIHDLTASPYQFSLVKGVYNDRFVLRYTELTLSNNDLNFDNSIIVFSKDNNSLKIMSNLKIIKSYEVYNVLGQLLKKKQNINALEVEDFDLVKNNQTLIVTIVTDDGFKITKKIIH